MPSSSRVPDPELIGLDFAIITFCGYLNCMWRGSVDIFPWFIAAGTVIFLGCGCQNMQVVFNLRSSIRCDGSRFEND